MDLAEMVKMFLKDKDPMEKMGGAELYGITADGLIKIMEGPDVYELLNVTVAGKYLGLGLLTQGWAAPLNKDGSVDGRPSEHQEAKRCVVFAACTADHLATGAKLEGWDEAEIETGSGTLADSLMDAVDRMMVA